MTGVHIATSLALALVLGGCFERAHPTAENIVRPVQVVRVVNTQVTDGRIYAGTVQPRREANIAFRVGGRIVARDVDVGALVMAGDVLARLDPTDLALSVRGAEADLATAQAQLTQAAADAARSRVLLAQGWTPAETDEIRQAASRSAIQKVASMAAALTMARNKLDYAVLRAPAAGTITAAMADPGTVVAEGQAVLRLAEAGGMEVEIALPEGVANLAPGAPATLYAWAHPDVALPAHLRELSRSADTRLRTYTARFVVNDGEQPGWLTLGMTASVRLDHPDTTLPAAATLPASALADRGGGQIVWVVSPHGGPDGSTVQSRPVQVRVLREDRALVSGLSDGDLVVSLGVQKLDPASRVRVATIQPTPTALPASPTAE